MPTTAERVCGPSERTRVVVVTGPPGVGKTETARRLVRRYQVPAALVDTDAIAAIHPWRVDEKFHAVLGRNLRTCLDSYRKWGAQVIVVSGVLLPGRALDQFADLLADPSLDWVFYGLTAPREELAARVRADSKVQEAADRLSWSHLNDEIPAVPNVRLVDTQGMGLLEVVARLAAAEAADLPDGAIAPPPVAPNSARSARRGTAAVVRVTPDEAAAVCEQALRAIGFDADTAAWTAADLVDAEAAGAPSHGLLRVPEYAQSVRDGHLVPVAQPVVRRTGRGAFTIDGRRAPGSVVRRRLAETLSGSGADGPVVVGLRNSGHLGRLSPIAHDVAAGGKALAGFLNYAGAGPKVAPFGGASGFWGTNPVLLACPAPPGPPLVADMSTSVVAEGVVRSALLAGSDVPQGLLVGLDGEPVTDPNLLYTLPPRAALLPAAGHKGHAWAAVCEVLAGVIAGAGHAADPGPPGNGGLFLAFPVDSLGRSGQDIASAVHCLEEELRAVRRVPGAPAPRLPGRKLRRLPETLHIPAGLWSLLREHAARPAIRRPAPARKASIRP